MSSPEPPPPERADTVRSPVSRASYARRSLLWLVLPLAAGAVLLIRYLAAGRAVESVAVAVLPFVAGGADTGAAVLADCLGNGLAEALGRVPGILVIGTDGAGGAAALPADVREAGRVLGARLVVAGRTERQGDTLAASTDLIDVATGERRGGGSAVRPLDALLDVEEDLAVDVARTIEPAAAARLREALRRGRAPSVAARQLLMRARFLARADADAARAEAAACLAQATHDAPTYAAAHAALATLHLRAAAASGSAEGSSALEAARAAAARALALDPDLAEAVAARGRVEHLRDRDLVAAERSLRRAVALAPSTAAAHLWLGELLAERGHRREAEAAVRAAARLAPLSPEPAAALARIAASR